MIVRRALATLGGFTALVITATPAGGQVAVPPLPPDVASVVEVVSPVVHPLCGDALLVSSIAVGLVPPALRELIQPFTGTPFIVCGLVPPPGARRMECEVDVAIGSLVDQVSFAVLGGASPFAPPETARLVDSLLVLQDRLPPPIADLDAVTITSAIVLCTPIVTEAPSPVGPLPTSPSARTTLVPVEVPAEPGIALPAPPVFEAPAIRPAPVGPSAPPPAPAAPVQPVARRAPLNAVTYPLFLVPLAVLAMVVVLARGLLATPHESRG